MTGEVTRTRDQIKDAPKKDKRWPPTSTIGSAWAAITPPRTCLQVISHGSYTVIARRGDITSAIARRGVVGS